MRLDAVRALIIGLALIAAAPHSRRPIVVYLAGDSTMAEKLPAKRPETGWGEMLQEFFDSSAVRVVNHARNGRSTRTFITEGRWKVITDSLAPGDYVFIQFGHNDASKAKTDRYTPPADYRANLTRFVKETRAAHAIPVLLTPVMRRRFDKAGTFRDSHGEYPDIVRSVASEMKVPLIDMHRRTEQLLTLFGPQASTALFLQIPPHENPNYENGIQDNTHFSPFGARVVASLAVEGIRAAIPDLAAHFRRMTPPIVPDTSAASEPPTWASIAANRAGALRQ